MQNWEDSYGIDWSGPIPDLSMDLDLVEVAETTCPFHEDQLATLPETEDLTHLDGVEAFQNIIHLTAIQ